MVTDLKMSGRSTLGKKQDFKYLFYSKLVLFRGE